MIRSRRPGRLGRHPGGLPGQPVDLVSWSNNRKHIVVKVGSATDGPGYALVDMSAGTSLWLGPEYLGLTGGDVAAVTPVRFKAKDGR